MPRQVHGRESAGNEVGSKMFGHLFDEVGESRGCALERHRQLPQSPRIRLSEDLLACWRALAEPSLELAARIRRCRPGAKHDTVLHPHPLRHRPSTVAGRRASYGSTTYERPPTFAIDSQIAGGAGNESAGRIR